MLERKYKISYLSFHFINILGNSDLKQGYVEKKK